MTSQFQTQVNYQPAPAVAGDFASANPRHSVLAGPGSLVAGAAGVTIGGFAWATSSGSADPSTGETDLYNTVASAGIGAPTGFVSRPANMAVITTWLSASTMVVPQGQMVTLHAGGDFWAMTSTTASAGQKVYANYGTGAVSTAATGTPPTNAGITASTATNTTLTVTANSGAPIVVGQPVSGAGIATGTYIAALGTGTGGAGTYTLSAATTATASGVAVTATTAVETKWYVMSAGAAGELIKISTLALG
jgi:hypothetical protein